MTNSFGLKGPGNDLKHQLIISFLIASYMKKFELKTYKNHFVVPELHLKPASSRIPDLTIYKKSRKSFQPIVLIEICNNREQKNDIEKLKDLMKDIETVQECFVVNKEDNSIYRVFRKKNLSPSVGNRSDICETFKLDLSKIIKELPKEILKL